MAYTYPSVSDFKTYFARDFPYPPTGEESNTAYVRDVDITKAQDEAKFNFNSSLVADQAEFSMLFNYLTAHFLVLDLRASSQGLNGSWSWQESSKGVGSVSQSFAIPEIIQNNPVFAAYAKTNYGAKYLNLIMPSLIGPFFTVRGRTLP